MASATATPRKRLRPEQRRELIVAAAERAFGADGYDGASLDTIAADAGVTKPVLYRHFGSKEDLYVALLDRHREELPTFLEGVDASAPIEELVRAVLAGWFAYADEHGARWRMIFRDSGGGERVRATREALYGDARQVLVAFLDAHPAFEVPAAGRLAAAEAIRGALSSLVLLGQEDGAPGRDELVEAGVRVVLGFAPR
jgi:AcrR family transcriptional regulator